MSDRYDLTRWPHPAPGRAAEETDRLRHGRTGEESDLPDYYAEKRRRQAELWGWLWGLWECWFWGRERRHR
jgi:hypothetical protein